MTPDESTIAKLFEPELSKIRLEFGDIVGFEVVSMLAEQLAKQVEAYAAEASYFRQRYGRDPAYDVCINFAAITQDLRAYQREQAAAQLARLRLVAQLN